MCIWDNDGCFVLAKTTWFSPLYFMEVREALGLYTALTWTTDLQLHNMNFVYDSKKVVRLF